MKHQALFPKKDKSKKNKVTSAAIFVWTLSGIIMQLFGGTSSHAKLS